jgi:hypothetical protein
MRRQRWTGSSTSGLSFSGARIVQPGILATSGLVSLTRSQASSAASTALNAAGTVWSEYAIDTPRFHDAAQGLWIEGQRTNGVRNPRAIGATTGVVLTALGASGAGALPTNWGLFDVNGTALGATGVEFEVTATTWPGGTPGIQIRVSGTPTVTGGALLYFESPTGIATTAGLDWTASCEVQLVAGATTNFSALTIACSRNNSATGQAVGSATTALSPSGTTARRSATLNITPQVRVGAYVNFGLTSGSAVDITLALRVPQAEQATFPSTPIYPATGTTVASTRGLDSLTGTYATLFPSGVGSVLGTVVIPQNAPTGLDQTLFEINDGTAANRIRLRNVAAGATIVAGRVISSASTDATSLGSMTAGTAFKFGLTFDGTTITGNFNGGTNQTVAGQPTGLTTFRVGNSADGLTPLFGRFTYLDVLPYAISGAALPTAVSGMP